MRKNGLVNECWNPMNSKYSTGELLARLQTLPLERRPPVVEKASRPGRPFVAPQLFEGFLEKVRRVQTLVGVEE
jgi:hypothetical protein